MLNIETGIYLEDSGTKIPWGVQLENIKQYGNPEIIDLPGGRTQVKWKGVTIFGGLKIDLVALFYFNFFKKKYFRHIFTYLDSLDTMNKLVFHFDYVFNTEHTLCSDFEYEYKWRTKKCKISVGSGDRFGPFYYLKIEA